MSGALKNRRTLLLAGAGIGVLAAAGLGYEAVRLLAPHHPLSPYGDLLALLSDRDAAAQVGLAYSSEHVPFDSATLARLLRKEIGSRPLSLVLRDEIARSHLVEAGGWLMPVSLVALSALAAAQA